MSGPRSHATASRVCHSPCSAAIASCWRAAMVTPTWSIACRQPTVPCTNPVRSASSSRQRRSSRSEEHTSELQSRLHLVCRLLLEKKKKANNIAGVRHFDHAVSDILTLPRVHLCFTCSHVSAPISTLNSIIFDITSGSHESQQSE